MSLTPRKSFIGCLVAAAIAVGFTIVVVGTSVSAKLNPRALVANAQAPDLAESVPSKLAVRTITVGKQRFYVLVFQTVAENLAKLYEGQLFLVGHRASTKVPMMTADQYINIIDPQTRQITGQQVIPNIGQLRFERRLFGHDHWHLRDFEVYELRHAANGQFVSQDHKIGFCLTSDTKVPDPGLRAPDLRAAEVGAHAAAALITRKDLTPGCGKHEPNLLRVVEAIDAGTGDVYERFLGGQSVDVTTAPNGRYVLIAKVNPQRAVVETNYTNDSASVLISIHRTKPHAKPTIKVLRSCPGTAVCG